MAACETRRDFLLKLIYGSAACTVLSGCIVEPASESEERLDPRIKDAIVKSKRHALELVGRLERPFGRPFQSPFAMSAEVPKAGCRANPGGSACLDPIEDATTAKNYIDNLVEEEFKRRTSLARELDSSRATLGEAPADGYMEFGSYRGYNFVRGQRLEVVPYPHEIDRIDPTSYTQDTGDDPTFVVVVDIILETLEMAIVERDVVRRFFQKEERLRGMIEVMVERISTQDWSDVAELFDAFLKLVMSAEFIARLGNYLNENVGRNRVPVVMRGIAKNLVARLVPFVGWIYLGISFLVAVRRNYDRLLSPERSDIP